MPAVERREVRVRGTVQGVGFRPWAARLARAHGLVGGVQNVSWGVRVDLEGPSPAIARWLDALRERPPEGARVESIEVRKAACTGAREFTVTGSAADSEAAPTRIPPDRALCRECLDDLFDPEGRRYRYAFTHCASCGPRAAVLTGLPFDRERTTLLPFAPCASCADEYADPADRRFHAESIACPTCGPRLAADGVDGDVVEAAAACVRAGGIVALRGYGGFHLVCDATRPEAVARLRKRKARPTKPFAVLVPDLVTAHALAELQREDEAWLSGPAHAVVIAPRRPAACELAALVAPRTRDLGLVLPIAPVHWLLLHGPDARPGGDAPRFEALVFTSANVSEEPTLHRDDAATRERLATLADLVVTHDRAVARPNDDPVVRSAARGAIPIRLSRSTAPLVLPAPCARDAAPAVLAVGGDLKAAPAVLARGEVVLGEHVGDLANLEAADALEARALELCRLLGVVPRVVAHDLHPDYAGTAIAKRLAERLGARTVGVQHHHAHAAAGLVEHGGAAPALALVLDGAGFGPDGMVWGGELLRFDLARAERLAHLEQVPLPGGDAAVREPWRMAWAWLHRAFPSGDAPRLAWHERRAEPALAVIARAAERGVASPLTSSCGRLFDAVASLLCLGDRASHEGELATALESLAEGWDGAIPTDDVAASAGPVIPVAPLVRDLVVRLSKGAPEAELARRFHVGLAERLAAAASAASVTTGLRRVVVTGGCLQNRLLREELGVRLAARGLEACFGRRLPPNDGGLAVGQAAVAAAR
ncbi:MAG: carbamoyltransferase HypF [Myxococcota bacterium]